MPGVTKAAVSFALNDQPGVSASTRQRILDIAREIGFQPSSAARALSDGRAGGLFSARLPSMPTQPVSLAGLSPE
jgi:DNA-binding LacI/PurR family transcriptional regulator